MYSASPLFLSVLPNGMLEKPIPLKKDCRGIAETACMNAGQ